MTSIVFGLQFAPAQWSWAEKFAAFAGPPFVRDSELTIGTAAVIAHREKYELLGELENEYADRMHEDHAELERLGFTPARRAKGGYGPEFPSEFTDALASAHGSWLPRLRQIRTLTTHGETGSCHLNRKTGIISYWHMGSSRSGGKSVEIEKVVELSSETYASIVALTEMFFNRFYLSLEPIERHLACGIYKGRGYERVVSPKPMLSFNDGRCWSREWFDKKPGHECPKRDNCAAYHRPASSAERDAYYARKPPPTSSRREAVNGVSGPEDDRKLTANE